MAKFKVKKGKKFFSGPRWNFFGINKGELDIDAVFWADCLYELTENYDQINKLTGQSYNIFPFYDKKSKSWKPGHHKNSVRFGWRCRGNIEIELLAYVYIDGVRKHKVLMSVPPYELINLKFKETEQYYLFEAFDGYGNKGNAKFKKNSTKKGFLGLFISRLYPYFGGRIAAPHNMRIDLEYLKKNK